MGEARTQLRDGSTYSMEERAVIHKFHNENDTSELRFAIRLPNFQNQLASLAESL